MTLYTTGKIYERGEIVLSLVVPRGISLFHCVMNFDSYYFIT